jgi:hypothetical protein
MRLVKTTSKISAAAVLALSAMSGAQAAQRICVYDLLGASGDLFNMAKDYVIAAQKHNVSIELKGYTDERVATEDFRTGQCDGVIATAFRTRQFNPVAGAIDSLGATTIVKDGKIDMPASYEVVRRIVQTFSDPKAGKLMVDGNYEVGGVIPLGAAVRLRQGPGRDDPEDRRATRVGRHHELLVEVQQWFGRFHRSAHPGL